MKRAIAIVTMLAGAALGQWDATPVLAVMRATAFSPLSISGCTLWLDASTIAGTNGQRIATWTDLSAQTNHASQSTEANQPTLDTSTIRFSVKFVRASSYWMRTTRSFHTTSLTLFLAFRSDSATGDQNVILTGSASGIGLASPDSVVAGRNNVYARGVANNGDGASYYGTNRVVTLQFNASGNSITMRNNGAAVALDSATYNPVSATGGYWIGKGDAFAYYADMHMFEVIAYNTVLTSAQVAQVEAYLRAKWGTP